MKVSRWKVRLEMRRKGKDRFFREDPRSPIPPEKREGFRGLSYYPINPNYRFELELHEHEKKEKVRVAATHGGERVLLRWGEFRFKVGDEECRLQAYKSNPQEEHLFVPFRDATSGAETYGAGRYLDLKPEIHRTTEGKWILDFNEAYNPWCAYSEAYVCPFIPPENWLKVPLRAGEKTFLPKKSEVDKTRRDKEVTERELTEELDNAIDTSHVKVKWVQDPRGYFTIKPFPSRNMVFVRYYDLKNNLKHTFAGITTPQIIQEIIERGLISRLDHAAYLGKEIEKAITALKNDLGYIQDEELAIRTGLKNKKTRIGKKEKKIMIGYLFNRIEKLGEKTFNHIGCEGESEKFGEFIASFVPEVGMKRKVRLTIEAVEEGEEQH